MTLKDRLEADMKTALRAKDADRLKTVRMLRSQLQTRELALRPERGRDWSIDDAEATVAIAAYAKQRREAIESYRAAGREDRAAEELRELAVVEEYLPRQLGEDEVRTIVREVLAGRDTAGGSKDLGAAMRAVMPRLKGAADGKLVNRVVREELERSSG